MDQTSGTIPTAPPAEGPNQQPPAEAPAAEQPGFGSRGRIRRRARFLRKARELAYRDLGGLVFNLHRFGERNDSLVLAKLATLNHIDTELRTIETALGSPSPITVLREAGITACPRCAAIHGSEDRFCPNCGLPLSRQVDLPISAGAPATPPPMPASSPSTPAGEPLSPPSATASPPAAAPTAATAGQAPAAAPSSPPGATPAAAELTGIAGAGAAPAELSRAAGRAPSPPVRSTPPAAPVAADARPEDSTEILRPPTPSQ